LEKGFAETSVADITTRAGVSRSSFFNYFATKSDVLWAGFDERVAGLAGALVADDDDAAEADAVVRRALAQLLDGFDPDMLALALAQADAMGLADEIERESAVRQARIARVVSERLRAGGVDPLHGDVFGAAYGGAVLAALARWAGAGAGRTPLGAILARALAAVAPARAEESTPTGERAIASGSDPSPE